VDELTKEFVAESQEGLERMELCLTDLEKSPSDVELVAEIFRTVHTIKGTTGFLGFRRLEKLAHSGEGLLATLRDGKIAATSELIGGLLELMDGLRAILHLIETTGTEGARSTDDDRELIALMVELKAGSTVTTANGGPAPTAHELEHPVLPADWDMGRAHRLSVAALTPALPATASTTQDRTLRIDVEVLNRMMNLVGELVLTRNQILQSSPAAQNFPELARRLNNVTADLRLSVMQARMQPVGHLFGKFPRIVRDLGRTCGRQVRIEFEGQQTGLDKSLLEAVRDPLTHAVRNAVDHGIEPPEVRRLAGKPVEGVVRLRAFHQSGSVVIEVIDDGAGISTEQVLAKAIERGLVTPEQAASMSQREALQMLFVPGFSTAREVTNISGRGVGLDVVRANVEQVGGSVELESRLGSGTTMRMRVPLTLAIVPALVVRSGGQSFALPQNALVELVYVTRREAESQVERIGASELYRLRDGLLPLVWLDRLLDLAQSPGDESQGFYIAVLESDCRRFGLVVDDLKPPEEIVVKSLSAVLREIGLFSGATLLGNGTLAMILDVTEIGARAGVRPAADTGNATETELTETGRREQAQIAAASSVVVYETWKRGLGEGRRGARMAMPLSSVERIESVPIAEIEYAGGRPVLQYGGELLALEDEDDALLEMAAASPVGEARTATGATATILICLRPGETAPRRVGVVVRRVVDVSSATMLDATAKLCAEPLAMVKDRVTTLHPDFAGQRAGPAFQEVA
jgi:two-component system chemotaxis sensor kinase CheA